MIVSPEDCQVYEKKIIRYKKDINYMHELIVYRYGRFIRMANN